MPERTLDDWLLEIEQYHPVEIELGLERIKQVAEALDCRHFACPVISVAGTNGKGSTVELLRQLALQQGKRVAVYSSPHLFHFNERIVINHEAVSDEVLIQAFEQVNACRQRFNPTVSLTYFEFTTLAALLVFKQSEPDLVVLEVGLGGRLDAVNIVDADIAVITSIGIDHEAWLGNTREKIAREKAGIARAGKPVVLGDPEPPAGLKNHLQEIACQLFCVNEDFAYRQTGKRVSLELSASSSSNKELSTARRQIAIELFPGSLAAENLVTAIQAYFCLTHELSDVDIQNAVKHASIPGRFQQMNLGGNAWLIADLTHNPAGAVFFARQLSAFLEAHDVKRVNALCGVMKDKDFRGIVSPLADYVDNWHLCDLPLERAATADELQQQLVSMGLDAVVCHRSVDTAMDTYFLDTRQDELLLVFGSFHTVAPALSYLHKQRQ